MNRLMAMLTATFLLVACTTDEPAADVVARVNDEELTLRQLSLMIPDYDQLDSLQRSILVENWIREALFSQEARKNLLHRDPVFKERVDTYSRRLLADKQLENVLKREASIQRSDIETYYNENLASFKRISDEFYGFHAIVPTYDLARQMIRAMRNGDLEQRQELLGFHPQETGLFRVDNLMPEIRDFLIRRKEAGVYGPVRTDLGYHVIDVRSWYDQGTILSLDEVWEEIAARLSINAQRGLERWLLDSLRSEATIVLHTETL